MRLIDRPSFSEQIEVTASPDDVWTVVSDIAFCVGQSAELSEVRWVDDDPAPGAAVGRQFVGVNSNEHFGQWETTATITECDRPRAFGWAVGDVEEPNTSWRFELAATDGGATTVTQSGRLGYGASGLHIAIGRFPDKEERIVARRIEQFRAGMRANLAAVKEAVER